MEKKRYRLVRVAVAALVMLTLLVAFGGWRWLGLPDGAAPASCFAFQGENLLARLAASLARGLWDHALAAGLGLAALLALTWAFGRFYCGALCPLGILQDVVAWLCRRPGRPLAAEGSRARAAQAVLPFAALGCVLGFLLAGRALVLSVLGPYAGLAGHYVGWLLEPELLAHGAAHPLGYLLFFASPPALALLALVIWRHRFFCQYLCPVGAMLRLAAARGAWRLKMDSRCVGCGRCARACAADCIDPKNKTIDNSRCVRCLNCLDACPRDAVCFARAGAPGEVAPPLGGPVAPPPAPLAEAAPPAPSLPAPAVANPSRRELLYHGAVLAGSCVAAWLWARDAKGPREGTATREMPLPPGAGTPEEFAARCTHCNLCAAACPTGVIARAQPVVLDMGRKACAYDCHACSAVCPTGALRPLTLEQKRRLRIAAIVFTPAQCLAFAGEKCGRCAAACPAGAMATRVSPTGFELPRLDPARCIGCGACVAACPAAPQALAVKPVERQEFI